MRFMHRLGTSGWVTFDGGIARLEVWGPDLKFIVKAITEFAELRDEIQAYCELAFAAAGIAP